MAEQPMTTAQADGLACVKCGTDYLTTDVGAVPVGTTAEGGQVFACETTCTSDEQDQADAPAPTVAELPAGRTSCPVWCNRAMPHGDLHEAVIVRLDEPLTRRAVVTVDQPGDVDPSVAVWAHATGDSEHLNMAPGDAVVLARALGAIESSQDLARFRRALVVGARMATEATVDSDQGAENEVVFGALLPAAPAPVLPGGADDGRWVWARQLIAEAEKPAALPAPSSCPVWCVEDHMPAHLDDGYHCADGFAVEQTSRLVDYGGGEMLPALLFLNLREQPGSDGPRVVLASEDGPVEHLLTFGETRQLVRGLSALTAAGTAHTQQAAPGCPVWCTQDHTATGDGDHFGDFTAVPVVHRGLSGDDTDATMTAVLRQQAGEQKTRVVVLAPGVDDAEELLTLEQAEELAHTLLGLVATGRQGAGGVR